jgi:hypothetical protein
MDSEIVLIITGYNKIGGIFCCAIFSKILPCYCMSLPVSLPPRLENTSYQTISPDPTTSRYKNKISKKMKLPSGWVITAHKIGATRVKSVRGIFIVIWQHA